jgi:uncharacterized damage-inducible protein DinB
MKEYVEMLFRYNRKANDTVLTICGNLSDNALFEDRRAFVKSLFGLLDHITEGESYFLKQVRAAFPQLEFLNDEHVTRQYEYNTINFSSLDELGKALRTCDAAYLDFVGSIAPSDFEKVIAVEAFAGLKRQRVGHLLLQAVNHSTHHRGQVSQILDVLGIPNDYSGLPDMDGER